MITATIFDIQRNSFVDGPGIRTTVFFKGCNLRCAWCHNPESQNPKTEMLFYKNKCTMWENVKKGVKIISNFARFAENAPFTVLMMQGKYVEKNTPHKRS